MPLSKIFPKSKSSEKCLLSLNIFLLKLFGLLLPKTNICRYLYFTLVQLPVILVVITQFVELWFVRSDHNLLLINLKISMISAVDIVKIASYIVFEKKWRAIIEYASRADLHDRSTAQPEMSRVMESNTLYGRRLTFTYMILMTITVIFMVFHPILKYAILADYRQSVRDGALRLDQILPAWVPFDKNSMLGYTFMNVWHAYTTAYAGGMITSFDSTAVVLMVFFGGQIDLLKIRCARMYDKYESELSTHVSDKKTLVECHNIHLELIKHAKLFNSLLSPVMFFYVIVCSIMLCASAYQMLATASAIHKLMSAEYLIFGIVQLFIYCWHSNDVFYKSQQLRRGPYESPWWSKKPTIGRDLVLLTGQLSQTVMFTAGPFTNLTVPTFITILKGAYSYYTLLNKS